MEETMKAKVTVSPRRGVRDPQGRAVLGSLHALGFPEVVDVRVGRFIELIIEPKGEGGPDEVEARRRQEQRLDEMCRRLLANTLIEDYRFETEP